MRARRRSTRRRCRRASRRCRSPTRAYDAVVASTVLYTRARRRDGGARARARHAPGGALLLMEPAFDALRRAHDAPCTHAAATAAARSPSSRPRPGSPCSAAPTRTPSSRRRRPRSRASTAAWPAGRTRGDSDVDKRALDRVFAPLAAPRACVARAPRRARRHLGACCSLPADRRGPATTPQHDQLQPRAQRGPRASARWHRRGRTPTCRAPGGSGARPPR